MTVTKQEQRLIDKINKAPDFGYDDDWQKLSKSLAKRGLKAKWSMDNDYNETIQIIKKVN